jgi:hypothetical protein
VPRKSQAVAISAEQIERQIHLVRGQRVMLDSDLAKLYQVPTKVLNQAVKRNRSRFPDDFAFQLTGQEVTDLKSQFVTSSLGHGGRRKPPWVFTEHGVSMLSSVLHSRIAVQVNVEIMRAFIRMGRLLATPGELAAQLTRLAESVQLHDHQIKVITEVLRKLMQSPADARTGRIGFRTPEQPASGNAEE